MHFASVQFGSFFGLRELIFTNVSILPFTKRDPTAFVDSEGLSQRLSRLTLRFSLRDPKRETEKLQDYIHEIEEALKKVADAVWQKRR